MTKLEILFENLKVQITEINKDQLRLGAKEEVLWQIKNYVEKLINEERKENEAKVSL